MLTSEGPAVAAGSAPAGNGSTHGAEAGAFAPLVRDYQPHGGFSGDKYTVDLDDQDTVTVETWAEADAQGLDVYRNGHPVDLDEDQAGAVAAAVRAFDAIYWTMHLQRVQPVLDDIKAKALFVAATHPHQGCL